MIVWGGTTHAGERMNTGGRYCVFGCDSPSTWYQDHDGDGYGTTTVQQFACDQPAGFTPGAGDCNDWNAHCTTNCTDADGDGWCVGFDCNDARPTCGAICADQDGDGVLACEGDCNDGNPNVHPGAVELCNGFDDNCNGTMDEGGDALCNDNNICTADTCNGGGGCTHVALTNGTACNDGNSCTTGDVCSDGVCGVPLPEGAACNDSSVCTTNDTCRAGSCVGSLTGLPPGPAWMSESDQASALWGQSVASAGDVNGDGYSDVIVGVPQFDGDGTDMGRAYVFLGSSTGLSAAPAWMAEGDQAGAFFGFSVATAGDVNRDGFDDVVIGARLYTNGQYREGRAYLYLGSASGLYSSPAWTAESNQGSALFGSSVATAGDVNGDGYSDVIVGAPNYDTPLTDAGKVYVYLGSASGLSAAAAWTVQGTLLANLGFSVATAGDVNHDGYSDVIVGAPLAGRAYVYKGSATGLSTTPLWTGLSLVSGDWFGYSVATAGDVNGDGYADVIVGAHRYTDYFYTYRGAAVLYTGSAAGVSANPARTMIGNGSAVQFGYSVSSAGDVNGDAFDDVVVGANGEGRSYVYLGAVYGLSSSPWWAGAVGADSVATAGDTNGDGFADVIVGAPYFDNGQTDEGRSYLYRFGPVPPQNCDDANPCTTNDACAGGVCAGAIAPNGTSCSDGNACTQSDACSSGVCSGTPVSPPTEVGNQHFTSKTLQTWDPPSGGGPGLTYDVVRGLVPQWPVGSGVGEQCRASGTPTAELTVTEVPPAGTSFWFLVRARTACGTGSYGTSSSGTPRSTGACL